MEPKTEIKVEILVMDRHFLYLPLYLAQFDQPKIDKLPFFGMIPPEYSVEVVIPQREINRTDAAVFDILMNDQSTSNDIMFAVCDPTVLLARQDKNALMAASIVSSSAFWAVNHDAKDVKLFSDLSSFERILCYGDKTTSNLIARRIARRDTNKLTVVQPTSEILALEQFGERTLAISPELLKIANLIYGPLKPGEKRAQIVLELCTTKEFSNVLTTALFTRVDVIERHPKLVSGLLAALQRSLLAIHAGDPMVVECAKNNYSDAYHLTEALDIARNGNVFPETIHVRRDRWQRACEFYHSSHAMAEGRTKNTLTKAEQLEAEKLFKQAVLNLNLQKLVTEAITRGFNTMFKENSENESIDDSRPRPLLVVSGAFLLIASGFAVGHMIVSPAYKIPIASWATMLFTGWLSGELFGYCKRSPGYVAHWIGFLMMWWSLHSLSGLSDFVPGYHPSTAFSGGILGVSVTYVISIGLYVHSRLKKLAQKGISAIYEH